MIKNEHIDGRRFGKWKRNPFIQNSPTNSAKRAFGNLCFFDESSFIPSLYLNDPAISEIKAKRNTFK